MRILIVTDHYPPFIGGAHRQSYVLSQKLHQAGHTVAVVTVWHPKLPVIQDDDGVRVFRFRQLFSWIPRTRKAGQQRHHPPFPDFLTAWRMRRLIKQFCPDVVHVHGWISYSLALAVRGMKIPMLVSGRDYGYRCATRTLLYKDRLCSGPAFAKCVQCANSFYGTPKGMIAVLGVFASLPLLRRSITGFHSISHFVQDFTETTLLRNGKSIPNHPDIKPSAIIPSFLVGLDDTVGLSSKFIDQLPAQPFMLFVGAIMRRKGVYQLLEAYQQLVSPPPLVLIGTLEHDSPASFPPGVVVLQNFPHSCVMAAWERCLFGVVPSLWPEPLGAVVFEAMSRGKAVIGTKPGGHEEMIIDGETGYLVPQGDVEAFRRAMQCLIDNDAMRESFGLAGQARLAQFTAEAALPQFEALYRRVITAGHPPYLNGSYIGE